MARSGRNGAGQERRPARRRTMPPGLMAWSALGLAILAVTIVLVLMGLSGRSIPVPQFVVARIEARANAALAGQAALAVGGADLLVNEDFLPQVRLRNVALISPNARTLMQVSDLRVTLRGAAFLHGELLPERLTASGARIALRRMADGSLDVASAATGFSGKSVRPADIVERLDKAFDLPALSGIKTIDVTGLSLLFDDARSGHVWSINNGSLALRQDPARLAADFDFGLGGEQAFAPLSARKAMGSTAVVPLAEARAALVLDKRAHTADLDIDLDRVSATDLAAQVPALAWLSAVDAPISGHFHSGIVRGGQLAPFDARLDLGAGVLRPNDDTRPIPFDSAHLAVSFDPATAAMTLSELKVASPSLAAAATGKAWVMGLDKGMPNTLTAQVQLTDFRADPSGIFDTPVSLSQGALDFKLDLRPFRLTIGQLVLVDRGRHIGASGTVEAGEKGWSVALDIAIDAIETDRLLALWPVSAVPNTRVWLHENVENGELFDVKGALRLVPGHEPKLALDYQFRGAEVKYLKTLPPIVDGAGYASIEDYSYTLVVDKGRVTAPKGGDLDVTGSVVRVPDIRQIPARADITLKSKSSVTAALAILDEPPFQFMSKAGLAVDMAEGRAEVSADLGIPLVKNLKTEDVAYRVSGQLLGVRSDQIVKGRALTADALRVVADPKGIEISGDAALDGVPVSGTWRQAFGPENKGKSRVEGTVSLTPAALDTFSIGLPKGAVAGQGSGQFSVDLARGAPPALHLESDLRGLTLQIPEVQWTKPAAQAGKLTLDAQLGTPPRVDRLMLSGPGLSAEGTVTIRPEGSLDRAEFDKVKVGDWFSGGVRLTGRGKGEAVALAVTGGSADLRHATFGSPATGDPSDPPVELALDQLRVSDTISLANFDGTLTSAGGVSADFTGLVNGKAPVRGRMIADDKGNTAFRIQAADAGAVLAASGLYGSGRGGAMDLTLVPATTKGSYDGTLNIRDIRVVNAPALANLLGAISVVGLIDQLRGAGIVFSDVEGKFLLTPDAVEIRQGSAVGASLGVSAAGVYRSTDRALDIQGVISPIYLLNGIGQIFSRQRDGLFGFNYTLKGTPEATKVSVNPLSILTPGMFRDLFRKAPPTITDMPKP